MKAFVLFSNVLVRLAFTLNSRNNNSGVSRFPFFGNIIGAAWSVKYWLHVLSMDPSNSLAGLQVFLTMVQFSSCFIPNLASTAADLCRLTKKISEFVRSPEHQSASAVDHIKKVVAAPTSLQYFIST